MDNNVKDSITKNLMIIDQYIEKNEIVINHFKDANPDLDLIYRKIVLTYQKEKIDLTKSNYYTKSDNYTKQLLLIYKEYYYWISLKNDMINSFKEIEKDHNLAIKN